MQSNVRWGERWVTSLDKGCVPFTLRDICLMAASLARVVVYFYVFRVH
jgi:hypothetical protein